MADDNKSCCKEFDELWGRDSIRKVRIDKDHPIHWTLYTTCLKPEWQEDYELFIEHINYCPFCGTKLEVNK